MVNVRPIMMLLAINLLLFTGGVRVIGGDNDDFMSNFINVEEFDSTGQLIVSEEIGDTLPTEFSEGFFSSTFEFIDAVRVIASFLVFLVNIIFTPLGLFMSINMPSNVAILIGVPFFTLLVLTIASFFRSG